MTDKWPMGPYLVLEHTDVPLQWEKHYVASEAEARRMAQELQYKGVEADIYRYVADDEAYVLIEDVCGLCDGTGTALFEDGPGVCLCVRRKESP